LTATATQTIRAIVAAGSVAVSAGGFGASGSGAGAQTVNKIASQVYAYIDGDGADGISAASVTIKAHETASITATTAAVSVALSFTIGGAVSLAIALADNEIANDVAAYVTRTGDTLTTTSGGLTIEALSNSKQLFDLSGVATPTELDAADSSTLDDLRTAFGTNNETLMGELKLTKLSAGSSWQLLSTLTGRAYVLVWDASANKLHVSLASISAYTVSASVAGGVGAFSGAGSKATNTTTTQTRAFIDGSAVVMAAGDVSLTASDTSSLAAVLPTFSLAAGAVAAAGAVSLTTNTIGTTVAAHITGANVTSTSGGVAVNASFDGIVHAETLTVAIAAGIGVGVAVVDAKSIVNGSTQASLGTGAVVTANAGTVRVRSISNTVATAHMEGGSGAIGAAVTAITGTAQIGATTKASVADGASVHAAALTVQTDSETGQTTRTVNAEISAGSAGIVSVTDVEAVATITGDVEASIGKQAQITTSGLTTVRVKAAATASAKAGGGTGGLVAVGGYRSRAEIGTTATASQIRAFVDEGAVLLVGGLAVQALDTSVATATMVSGGGGAVDVGSGGSTAVVNTAVIARVGPAATATLLAATSITSTGNVGLDAQSSKQATATTTSGGGGVVTVRVDISGVARTLGSVTALIGNGTTIPEALGVGVNAEMTGASAETTVSIGSGGAIAISGTKATAESSPFTTAAIGDAVEIGKGPPTRPVPISGDVTVTATGRAEADATGNASGGGVAVAASPRADATVDPTVDAHIGTDTTATRSTVIYAHGNVEVKAALSKTGTGTSSDLVQAATASDDTLKVVFSSLHNGDTIMFSKGTTTIGGLRDGQVYTVLDAGTNLIRLGSLFNVSRIDPLRETITFTAPHSFADGDCVWYDSRDAGSMILSGAEADDAAHGCGSASAPVPGAKRFFVRVLDDATIQLTSTFAAATTDTAKNVTAISSTKLTLNNVAGIAVGTAVSYTAPVVVDFIGASVNAPNAQVQISAGPPATFRDGPGAHNQNLDNIWVGSTVYGQLNTGDAVRYTKLSGDNLSNLTSGGTYWVIKSGDGFTIKLAVDRCRALGTCVDDNGTPDDPDDDFTIPQTAINLSMIDDEIGNQSRYHIERSIGGLVSGQTYYVSAVNGNDISLTGVTFAGGADRPGPHKITVVEVDLQAVSVPPSVSPTQALFVNITSTAADGCSTCGKLLASSGQALSTLAPPTGDGKSGAVAKGGVGGVGDFAFPYAELKGTPAVTAMVAVKTIAAGKTFELGADSKFEYSVGAEIGSGGVIGASVAETKLELEHAPTTATVFDESTVTAGSDATVKASNDHTISSTSFAAGGDLGVGVRLARTRAQLDNDVNVVIGSKASLQAGGAVRIQVVSGTTADTHAETWVGGLLSGTALSDHEDYDNRGVHIGSDGDPADRKITVKGGAQITGNTVDIDANVTRIDLQAKTKAGAFGIANANAFSDSNVTVYSDARVQILNDTASPTTITGFRGVDIEARHSGTIDIVRHVFNIAVAVVFPQEGYSRGKDKINDEVNADKGALIVAGARAASPGGDLFAADTDQSTNPVALYVFAKHAAITPKYEQEPTSVFHYTGHTSADSAHVRWDANVTILGGLGGSPLLMVGADGKIKAINAVQLYDASGKLVTPNVGDDVPLYKVDPLLEGVIRVGDILNTGWADILMVAGNTIVNQDYLPPSGTSVLGKADYDWPVFEWRDTLAEVTIVNYSPHPLRIERIDVVNDYKIDPNPLVDGAHPVVELKAPGGEQDFRANVQLEFDVRHVAATSYVDIEQRSATACDLGLACGLELANEINNPVGLTRIINLHGNITAGSSALVITNQLDVDALDGSVGSASPRRLKVDLITFILRAYNGGPTPGERASHLLAHGGVDVFLSLRGLDRRQLVVTELTIFVDRVEAGRDVDLELRDTLRQPGTTETAKVDVLVNQEDSIWIDKQPHDSHFRGYNSPTDGTNSSPSVYDPDRTGGVYTKDPALYLSAVTDDDVLINGFYNFQLLKAPLDRVGVTFLTTGLERYRGDLPDGPFEFVMLDTTTDAPAESPGLIAGSSIDVRDTEGLAQGDDAADLNVGPTIRIFGYTNLKDVTLGWLDVNVKGRVELKEVTDDMRVGIVRSRTSDVKLTAQRSIIDADTGEPKTSDVDPRDVEGLNIDLHAQAGSIGTAADFLETNLLDTVHGFAQTGTLDATAKLSVFLQETVGNLRLGIVYSMLGDASLGTRAGSIVDGHHDDAANVVANSIDLDANGGSIGEFSVVPALDDDLEIDSSFHAIGDVGMEAGTRPSENAGVAIPGSIHVTEVRGALRLVLAEAIGGDIRITVRERGPPATPLEPGGAFDGTVTFDGLTITRSSGSFLTDGFVAGRTLRVSGGTPYDGDYEVDTITALVITLKTSTGATPADTLTDVRLRGLGTLDEDLDLLHDGSVRFVENQLSVVPHGRVAAREGSVLLRIGDDVTTSPNSEIYAGETIDIYGDWTNGDEHFGTTMLLRGTITANCVPSGTGCNAFGDSTPAAGTAFLTRIWGDTDVDTFQFGDPTGVAGGTTVDSPGFMLLGSKTRVFGSQNLSADDEPDGEDRFTVYYLQTMNVVGGHSLTLDGQAETDTYTVWTTGSQGSQRNYVVNVLDTGDENDGVDELAIYGKDSTFDGGPTPGTKYEADDIFLLRAATCIDPGASGCTAGAETADRPAYVALVAGSGGTPALNTATCAGGNDVDCYRDLIVGNEPGTGVQRVYYDTALNGRLTVYGRGGNDAFFSDDTTAIVTLDGGSGDDSFSIGQIFGSKRDGTEGALLAQDVFPVLIATTRGWLSPGIHAPLVAQGGSGNDEFVVYSNQAELRLEGDDGNDSFIVRAFALAAVVDRDANGDGLFDLKDIEDPYGTNPNASGVCQTALDPNRPLTSARRDSNGDGVCNAADAHMTTEPDEWQDDVIPLDANRVARPIIGLGFSTARPLDIRAGGGEDEVSYNVNAPVSLDGGSGFDKVVVLGTEFADDIVITAKGVFGGGLNVRFANVEVVEVDGLEGDDEFFVQSTAFGVAYRVIGGLGSDTINVTGDVVEDIVVKELEGVSGAVNHLVTSNGDPLYDGLVVDGVDLNVATPTSGNVIITETGGFTAVREGGPIPIDRYDVRLAANPTGSVYVTVSAARSPQEEADGLGPSPLKGDTVWLCTGATDADCDDISEFQRYVYVNSTTLTPVAQRALVLTFTGGANGDWNVDKHVYVLAFNDLRPEGTRVVAVNHSVISTDDRYDGTLVRNVEVTVRDDDTPGVFVLEVEPTTTTEDGRSIVIEGDATTALTDELLVQLAAAPALGTIVVVHLLLDAESDAAISISSSDTTRFDQAARTIKFTRSADGSVNDWNDPVRLVITPRNNDRRQDPRTAVIEFERHSSTTDASYTFPSLYAPPVRTAIEVLDDETAGAVVLESGGGTVVVFGGATDDYFIRLTKQPTAPVNVAILTDGLTDVASINGQPVTYQPIGGYLPTQLFGGAVTLGNDGSGRLTITRTDAGSFLDEGFEPGLFVRIALAGTANGDRYVFAVTESTLTLADVLAASGSFSDARVSKLVRSGLWEGQVTFNGAAGATACSPQASPCRQLTRTVTATGWLADGFLEGQRVRVCLTGSATCADFKIALIRGGNATKDETLQFTSEGSFPAAFTGTANVTVTRLAAVLTFTGNAADANAWFKQQRIELVADAAYAQPPGRDNVKVYPVSTHMLSKLRGPLAVEGGTTAADRSLRNGVKLAGEKDAALFAIPVQPQESSQIDVLNVFNDSSQADGVGTMTSTTLTGFGMATGLTFGGGTSFGEPSSFPGGISFGTIAFANGQFTTDGAKSTIEVLNVLLGQGNDRLTITGTLDPADETYVPVTFTGSVTVAPTGGAGTWFTLTRATGSWVAAGSTFAVGQQALVAGVAGTFRVVGVTASVLTLERGAGAPALAAGTYAATVSVPGSHGGLTVVHGGGNHPMQVNARVDVATNSLTRLDGLAWLEDGFQAGQRIQIDGSTATWLVAGFADVSCTAADPFANCGKGSRMLLTGAALTAAANVLRSVAVVDPRKVEATGSMSLGTSSITRTAGSWSADGFLTGMAISISGLPGTWTIASLSATTLGLSGAAIVPAAAATRTVFGYDPAFAGAVHMGGDHLHVGTYVTDLMTFAGSTVTRLDGRNWAADGFAPGRQVVIAGVDGVWTIQSAVGDALTLSGPALSPRTAALTTVTLVPNGVLGGPGSPLVLYGDTSQDGVWYGGNPETVDGHEFGDKPFNPFVFVPDAENEDDEWVFPLGNPFHNAGNDVIDASALFAYVVCNATCSNLPSVGVTAYGGAGNDLLVGSQAGDFLAGGSGDDTILGLRGIDQIYGDSGVNVDLLTRGLTIPSANVGFTSPNVDLLLVAGRDLLSGEGAGTIGSAGTGTETGYDDVIFGDHGSVTQFVADPNQPNPLLQKIQTTGYIREIRTVRPSIGADDVIHGNAGRDRIFGGNANDTITGDGETNAIFGDHGRMQYVAGPTDVTTLHLVESIDFALGGTDHITANGADDFVLGGAQGDLIQAGDGQNVVFGDHGRITGVENDVYNRPIPTTSATFPNAVPPHDDYQIPVLQLVESISAIAGAEYGGDDRIFTGLGRDMIFGGALNDLIVANVGENIAAPNDHNNIVFGDYGLVDYLINDEPLLEFGNPLSGDPNDNAHDIDRVWSLASALSLGGDDDITTGVGSYDIIIGGAANDTIHSGQNRDLVFGDNARLTSTSNDNPNTIYSVHEFSICIIETFGFGDGDAGDDTIFGSDFNDILFGGGGNDVIYGLAGNDLIFGDQGKVTCAPGTSYVPDDKRNGMCIELGGSLLFVATNTTTATGSGDDLIFAGDGDDIVMGQQGRDVIFGGAGDDLLIGGSNVAGSLDADDVIDGGTGNDAIAGDNAECCFRNDLLDPRFQQLTGPTIYGTSIPAGTDGVALVSSNPNTTMEADPTATGPTCNAAAGFVGCRQYKVNLLDHSDTTPATLYGSDYIAGAAGADEIWGQLGNDVIQGDGQVVSYTDTVTGLPVPLVLVGDPFGFNAAQWRAWRAGDAHFLPLASRIGASRDSSANDDSSLNVNPSVERATDGDDYIEGNGGTDTIFGGLGQDDIVGDSSDLYISGVVGQVVTIAGQPDTWRVTGVSVDGSVLTLVGRAIGPLTADIVLGSNLVTGVTVTPSGTFGLTLTKAGLDWRTAGYCVAATCRPAGADLIFGGAGIDLARSNLGDATVVLGNPTLGTPDVVVVQPTGHARDADVIAGDNAEIFRVVVRVGGTVKPGTTCTASAANTCFAQFVYDNYDGGLRIIPRAVQFLDYTLGGPAYNAAKAATDRGAADEIHGESGDDQAYGMKGNDVLFGEGQDDDLIGGYGDDWISGGTGDDGVIGDDGRISTSRNNDTVGEPLYGVAALLSSDPDSRESNGNVIDETIYTPGHVQEAVINRRGFLNKSVNLTPFNVSAGGELDTLFDANGYDDIVFGGLGNDFLHGGSGDDAMSGAEALPLAFVQTYRNPCALQQDQDLDACVEGLRRLDYGHPWNDGDVLHFGADTNPWHANNHIASRLGEFLLYNEYDPRRAILFNPDGTVWRCEDTTHGGHLCSDFGGAPPTGNQYFLNWTHVEGITTYGCGAFAPNGTCLALNVPRQSDGDDTIFGDLGNDWLVGGTGKDTLWGGWGNDLLNADDNLAAGCRASTPNGTCTDPGDTWLNDVPDTHPSYEDRAYGGAGLDILIGNTGGDRLIDWIGEFNSYIVPFAPFGIATVSRQVPPALFEFLYTLSKAQGADPTRAADNNPVLYGARNGEPYGEIGLVTQKDHGLWQDQSGSPTDPQAGNIPGGKRDVLRTADFNDGTLTGFAPDSGVWEISSAALNVAAASLGKDAAAVFYVDQTLPVYYEIASQVLVQKPTAGWKANAYLIFDYFSPTDFKFAGLDVALNKVVVGQRTAAGWTILAQAAVTGGVRDSRYYGMQVIVNGLVVSVVVDGQVLITRQYDPRFIEGRAYGLNKGLVGVGSDNSRGTYDNFSVQVLPPQSSFENSEDFADGAADLFTAGNSGSWSVTGGRYSGAAAAGSYATSMMSLPVRATGGAVVTLEATVRLSAGGRGGIVFDQYGERDFKYVQLDVQAGAVVVGHRIRNQWIEDARFTTSLAAGVDYRVVVVLNGTAGTVMVNGVQLGSFSYNGAVADGALGTISGAGTTTFDDVRVAIGARVADSPDSQPPVLTAPANLTRTTDAGKPTAFVSDSTIGTATATDNVPGVVVTRSGVPAGNLFAIGVTTITWTATDVFGNTTTKTQTVTVTDNQAPTLTAPPNVIRTVAPGTTSVVVSDAELGSATASDNSGSVTVVRTGVPAGNSFPLGTTTITYTATDPYGNTTVRTQTVTVTTTQLPTVSVAATDASGAEQAQNPIVFTVSRSSSTGTLAVGIQWSGAATLGSDYTVTVSGGTLSGNTLTFNSGSASVTVTITPVDDAAVEGTEAVTLTLLAGSGYTVGSPAGATGQIADNDAAPPQLSVADVTTTEGDRQTSDVLVTITLSAASTQTVTVVATTVAGTALAGSDFTSTTATITFTPGQTTRTFTVKVVGDRTREPTETFTVVLSSATNATVFDGTGVVTILDNDGALTAAAAPSAHRDVDRLEQQQLDVAVRAARAVWIAARPDVDLQGITVLVGDLDGLELGRLDGTTITIDATAAGWGWTVSGGAMDLVTVVAHEFGHALGLEHEDGGLMAAVLAPGLRLLPSPRLIRAERPGTIRAGSRVTIRARALRTTAQVGSLKGR